MQRVGIVRTYVHLGSVLEALGSFRFDIRRRLRQSHEAAKPLARQVFRNEWVPLQVRSTLFRSLVLSRGTHNVGAWSGLTKGELSLWQAGCLGLYRHMIPSSRCASHLTMAQICALAQLPAPIVLIRFERLRLFAQVTCRGFDSLHHLLESAVGNPQCWLSDFRGDLAWIAQWHPTPTICALHDMELPQLVTFVRAHPDLLATWVRKAWAHASTHHRAVDFHAWKPEASSRIACPQCGFQCKDKRGLHTHLAKKHGQKIVARYYSKGKQCAACRMVFSTRAKLTKHLSKSSPRCLAFLQEHTVPLTPAEEQLLSKQEAKSQKQPRAGDLCKAFRAPCLLPEAGGAV